MSNLSQIISNKFQNSAQSNTRQNTLYRNHRHPTRYKRSIKTSSGRKRTAPCKKKRPRARATSTPAARAKGAPTHSRPADEDELLLGKNRPREYLHLSLAAAAAAGFQSGRSERVYSCAHLGKAEPCPSAVPLSLGCARLCAEKGFFAENARGAGCG